jgi:MerR family mercuric resistance operon transcriptional regulator
MDGLTIGEVAHRARVHIETLRYYERWGLVASPPRSIANYRLYPEDAVRRVRFIKRAQELSFTLKEIKELLSLRVAPKAGCAEVRAHAEVKIAERTANQCARMPGLPRGTGTAGLGSCPMSMIARRDAQVAFHWPQWL